MNAYIPMALGFIAVFWPDGRAQLLTLAFLWAGVSCVVNAKRCGRFHCHLTGPLYLGLALMSGLIGLGLLNIDWGWISATFATGTALAYIPEFIGWKYVRPRSAPKNRA